MGGAEHNRNRARSRGGRPEAAAVAKPRNCLQVTLKPMREREREKSEDPAEDLRRDW